MERTYVSDEVINQTIGNVTNSLFRRLDKKGRGAYSSRHEALGVITEEFHELVNAARNDNNRQEFLDECMDVAVAAIFAIASKEAHPYKML